MTKSKHSLRSFPAVFDLNTLDGSNGFKAVGPIINDWGGCSISIGGDINGDGLADVALRARENNVNIYVIFGSKSIFQNPFNITNLDGLNGFIIPELAWTVSLNGDINGDGLADLAFVCPTSRDWTGDSYVIFGSRLPFPRVFDLATLNGANGFKIPGSIQPSHTDLISIGEDINGDGIDDFGLGVYWEDDRRQDESYVIFGSRQPFPAIFNLSILNGLNGFKIGCPEKYTTSLLLNSIGGDVNGDGLADIGLDGGYTIFGSRLKFPNPFDLSSLNGTNGFKIVQNWGQIIGGDINGDGLADVVIGDISASANGKNEAGEVDVIFGSRLPFPYSFDINTLNGENGFRIQGLFAGDHLGYSTRIAALGGDINQDNKADLVLSAPYASPNGRVNAGENYVIFGSSVPFPKFFDLNTLNGENGFRIPGLLAGDKLGRGTAIGGDIDGDGKSEIALTKTVDINPPSEVYFIFSSSLNEQNYGMLSYRSRFVSMNSTDDAGKVIMGSRGTWCSEQFVHTGDFNGDGRADLLCNVKGGENSIMLARNVQYDVVFVSINDDPNGRLPIGQNEKWCDHGYQELSIGDFNGDQKSDLLCRTNKGADAGRIYAMLSTGKGFTSMGDNPNGEVKVGREGKFCDNSGRIVVGDFDGKGFNDILCNDPTDNMIMVPNGTSFKPINGDMFGAITMGVSSPCAQVWCFQPDTAIVSGDFNGDGKTDLACNNHGYNMVMLSVLNASWPCDFKSIKFNGNMDSDGYIPMGKGKLNTWCDTSQYTLQSEDVDGDGRADLICNAQGVNKIMLCKSDGVDGDWFVSIDPRDPTNEGNTSMAGHPKWCLSQNIFAGDYNGDGLEDLLCNQGGQVVGANQDN